MDVPGFAKSYFNLCEAFRNAEGKKAYGKIAGRIVTYFIFPIPLSIGLIALVVLVYRACRKDRNLKECIKRFSAEDVKAHIYDPEDLNKLNEEKVNIYVFS